MMSSRCGPTRETPRWISSLRRSAIAAHQQLGQLLAGPA